MPTTRYLSTYRHKEIRLIAQLAQRGQSLAFVGLAGTGKSNLVSFLRDGTHLTPYLGNDTARVHFASIDGNTWQQTPDHLWQLMLEGMDKSQSLATGNTHSGPAPAGPKDALPRLKERIKSVCQESGCQLVFILDDFDGVLRIGPLPMLEQLNVLRSDGNRDRLSYLLFTKKLPHVLGRAHRLEDNSKFYDLFRHHIFALEPYDNEDAVHMLDYLNKTAGKPIGRRYYGEILTLAGGHARLLSVIVGIWAQSREPSGDRVAYFGAQPEVQQECRRLWQGLHQHEQEVAVLAAKGQQTAHHADVMDHLLRRGVLKSIAPIEWFSPLFPWVLRRE